MADLLNRLAEDLAQDAMRQVELTGDEGVIDAISKSLADTSTTFQEAFLTAIRYYKAEARARQLLPDVATPGPRELPAPEPKQAASRPAPADQDESPTAEPVKKAKPAEAKAGEDLDIEDIPYAEAEIVEEPAPGEKLHVGTGRLVPKPKVAPEDAENPTVEPEITGPHKAGR